MGNRHSSGVTNPTRTFFTKLKLREKILSLQSSVHSLMQKDLRKVEVELIHQRSILSDSLVAEVEVQELREKIARMESSIVSPTEKCTIEQKIATMQESITRAHQLKEKVSKLVKAKTCSKADFEEHERELNAVQTIFRKHQPGNLNNRILKSQGRA
jgi:hypothetical protein